MASSTRADDWETERRRRRRSSNTTTTIPWFCFILWLYFVKTLRALWKSKCLLWHTHTHTHTEKARQPQWRTLWSRVGRIYVRIFITPHAEWVGPDVYYQLQQPLMELQAFDTRGGPLQPPNHAVHSLAKPSQWPDEAYNVHNPPDHPGWPDLIWSDDHHPLRWERALDISVLRSYTVFPDIVSVGKNSIRGILPPYYRIWFMNMKPYVDSISNQ